MTAPTFTQIPTPTVQNDFDSFWPGPIAAVDIGAGFNSAAGSRYTGIGIPAWWTTAGNTNTGVTGSNIICGQVFSNGAGGTGSARADGFQYRPVLLAGGPTPTFQYPANMRVWRLQLVWQLQAAAVSDNLSTFLGMVIGNGGGPPNAPGNGYFGLVLDGAGRWRWTSRVTGALFGFAEQIDYGASDNLPHMLDIVMLSANGGANAQLQVYREGAYSGAPWLVRNWGPGSVLPIYQTTGKANGTSFVFGAYALDAAHAVVIQLVALRASASDFTPQGLQIL